MESYVYHAQSLHLFGDHLIDFVYQSCMTVMIRGCYYSGINILFVLRLLVLDNEWVYKEGMNRETSFEGL